MEFSERLTSLLEKQGITAYKVFKETGISQSALGKWKSGAQIPTADKLMILADYLGVSMDYLMGRTDDPRLHIQEVETSKGTAELHVSKPLTEEEIVLFREMLEKMGREK